MGKKERRRNTKRKEELAKEGGLEKGHKKGREEEQKGYCKGGKKQLRYRFYKEKKLKILE